MVVTQLMITIINSQLTYACYKPIYTYLHIASNDFLTATT